MTTLTEADVEEAALDWLAGTGWQRAYGPDIAGERGGYDKVALEGRLRQALRRINPRMPAGALDDALRRLTRPDGSSTITRNRAFHRMLTRGVQVEYPGADGRPRGDLAQAVDFDNHANNDWLAVNQFTITESGKPRRADIVLFLNGLPIGLIELKNAADEQATPHSAWRQLQTYQADLPTLCAFNELLIASDGTEARVGALGAGWEWFKPWRAISGERLAPADMPQLRVAIEGLLQPRRLLEMLRDFIAFEDDGGGPVKKLAGYHQFHAVRQAVAETLRAVAPAADKRNVAERGGGYYSRAPEGGAPGDRRVGVVWHTQGSGKSLTMAFYAARVIREPAMETPTLLVLTDRNDLDNQLFTAFSRCEDLLGWPPTHADSRADLRDRLSVAAGGIVFSTIQKFFEADRRHPVISDRRNIVVIADEAHRSQYDFVDGFAGQMRDALPNASFIGFTGTPIARADADTRAVFGDYISVYDIQRSVLDGATVPIYYESRQAKLVLDESERPGIDAEFEEATEGEELERKERLKSKWAQMEAIVGAERRLDMIAEDMAAHFDRRLEAMDGKALVVCMSRRICVDMYNRLTALRPEWHSADDDGGAIKVVMIGSASDPAEWQPHIRGKQARDRLARRFRDPDDPLRIAIVRDMWLTGFDAPPLHTLYIDKPMRGHGLMQAIARVNRVFRDKPGGLVVDYLGLSAELQAALASYTESSGQGAIKIDIDEAARLLQEKHEICRSILHGLDWSAWDKGDAAAKVSLLPAAQERVLAQPDGKARFIQAVSELTQAFALAAPHDFAMRIRGDVAFFQAARAALEKRTRGDTRSNEETEFAVRQIIDRAIASDDVIDIFAAAGLPKPDISILSDEFMDEVRAMPHRNLAVELLRKLLQSEIRVWGRKNVVQERSFTEMLRSSLIRYQNRAVAASEVIEELIGLAREMRAAGERGEELGLSDGELAFYDALAENGSVAAVMGDSDLSEIARALVAEARRSVSLDWQFREDTRAALGVKVRRILHLRGYPPARQERAAKIALLQAELLSQEWLAAA